MKYTTLLTAFALTGAIASPVHKRHLHNKRAYVTDVEVVTKTVYVTLGQQAPTPAPVPDKPAAQQPAPEQGGPVEPPAAGPIVVTTTIVEDPERSPKPSPKPSPKLQPEPQPEPEREPEPKPDLPKKPADDDFQSLALYHHNIHRANHSAADLVWDNGLADAARQLAESCYYEHNT